MSRKSETYGTILRRLRRRSGKSMGALARELELSTPYLCDVELDRRRPLSSEHTMRAAVFIGADPTELLRAAAGSREEIGVRTPCTSKGQTAMIALQRRSGDLTDEQWERIQAVIDGDDG
jgi:transcriptional regulator with XRE-family HTH domain